MDNRPEKLYLDNRLEKFDFSQFPVPCFPDKDEWEAVLTTVNLCSMSGGEERKGAGYIVFYHFLRPHAYLLKNKAAA